MNPTLIGSIKSKLMWLGLAVSIMGYVQANMETLAQYIPQKWVGLANVGLGLAIMIARTFTTQSLTDKGTSQ